MNPACEQTFLSPRRVSVLFHMEGFLCCSTWTCLNVISTSFPSLKRLKVPMRVWNLRFPRAQSVQCELWSLTQAGSAPAHSADFWKAPPQEVTGREAASPALVSSAARESVRAPFCCVRPGPVLRMCAPVAWLVQRRDLMLISSSPCAVRLAGSQDTLSLLRLWGDAIGTHLGWSACVYRKCLGNASPVTPNFSALRVFCSGGLHFDNLSF